MTDAISDTRARLQKFAGRYPEIAERCGRSYSWLSKFARGARGKRVSFAGIEALTAVLDQLEGEQGKVNAET